ncbi:Uncharacterized protein TCM_022329 [Theobroma cacao]|uniref:Uncharacterized protein n=1 Tax=Theobroma cacao TaxID=3641 RepID=A0A061F0G7_THECC|nr:Uncharacterized protein TCM_022329 [Theobroma cacao]
MEDKFGLLMKRKQIKQAIDKVMDKGNEGEERRQRAKEFGKRATKAIEEGGSSYENMEMLIKFVLERTRGRLLDGRMLQNCGRRMVKSPGVCSWNWRKLLKLRAKAKILIQHLTSNGEGTFLWYDAWHLSGLLLDKFGMKLVYDSAISDEAKVANVIKDVADKQDVIIWLASSSRKFTTSDAWDSLKDKKAANVPWHELICFRFHIPKFIFIAWLHILNRFKYFLRNSVMGDFLAFSYLCSLQFRIGKRTPLVFTCSYSQAVWRRVLQTSGNQRSLGD